VLFAAWLVDTWTHGALVRWCKGWWAELSAAPVYVDVKALSETVVAEAIGITRAAAEGGSA
jgi:hypothetical protein